MSEQMQQGQQWLETLLQLMGLPAPVKISTDQDTSDSSAYWLVIDDNALTPEQIQALLGERGANLDAMQYLANAQLNMGLERDAQQAMTVELKGYRQQRHAELQALVKETVEKVRETGEEVAMESLSAAERRQVHSLLQDSEDLVSESQGQEPDRHLIVRLRGESE